MQSNSLAMSLIAWRGFVRNWLYIPAPLLGLMCVSLLLQSTPSVSSLVGRPSSTQEQQHLAAGATLPSRPPQPPQPVQLPQEHLGSQSYVSPAPGPAPAAHASSYGVPAGPGQQPDVSYAAMSAAVAASTSRPTALKVSIAAAKIAAKCH